MAIGTPAQLGSNATDNTAQTTLVVTLATGASIGDRVVVVFGHTGSVVTVSAADTQGNTYALDRYDGAGTRHSGVLSTSVTTALIATNTITLTFSGSINYPCAAVYKSSGIATSGALDQVNGATGTSTTPSSGNITTTVADELLWGVVYSVAGVLTQGTGWTLAAHHGTSVTELNYQYRIVAATGTYVSDGTMSSSDWSDSIVSYKQASTTTVPKMSLLGVG